MQEFKADDFINHRYRVVRCLGRGAMGTVYLVEDILKVHRLVALKLLKSDNLDDPDLWSKGEYEALTRLRHPHLARVFDFGRIQDRDDFYIVSEFIRGQDLFSATRSIDLEEFLDIFAQMCRALDFIHMQGYVHFDIKPDNILITRERTVEGDEGSKVLWNPEVPRATEKDKGPPRVKVIDFGLAERITGSFDFAIKGTFHYVAPEIIRGKTPDKRADLYSLGVTLYKVLTGQLPFIGEDGKTYSREGTRWKEAVRRNLEEQPSYLTEILVRLLEDDPGRRFSSARDIIKALNAGAGRHYQIETAETQLSYLYSPRLVGRQKELNRLKDEAEKTFHGPATLRSNSPPTERRNEETAGLVDILRDPHDRVPFFLISGEIGSGKSRLFEDFSHFLKMREIPVHLGNCYETCHDAYQPFRELISQAVLSLGTDSDILKGYRASVQKLCPGLKSPHQGEEGETGFRPDKERLYFIDQLAHFMLDTARRSPCVLAINNLHWADEASVELLAYLVEEMMQPSAETSAAPPLMLVATIRSDENLAPGLRGLLASLREEERIREIPLRRFTRTQIAELIHNMLHLEEIPTPFLNRLEERTSGNPLFIVETLKGLQEEGIITRDGEAWKIRTSNLSRIEIPHGIEAILLRRVRMLEVYPRRFLEALAVYGKPISGRLFQRLGEFSGVNVLNGLRELENRGMVVKSLEAGRLYFSISQPKLREIVYDNIGQDRRRALHGSLADGLAEEFSGREEEIIEELAYHYQRSDRVGKALELTICCGDNMRSIFAHDRALHHYRHVLKQIEGDPEHLQIWISTHEKLGDIGTINGDYKLAERSYSILLDEALTGELSGGARARLLRKSGKLDEIQGEYDSALRRYKQAREFLEKDKPSEEFRNERVKTLNAIAWVYVCMGKYEKALTIAVEALRVMEGLMEKIEHAMIFTTVGCANFYKGHLEQAIEYHSRALEICENLENVPMIITCLNHLGEAYRVSSEYTEALKHYQQALATAEEIGDACGRGMAYHNLADVNFGLGEIEESRLYVRRSLKISRQYRMAFLNNQNYLLRGKIRRSIGELAKAEGDLFRALGIFAKQGNRWGVANCLLEIAEVQLENGDHLEAIKLIQEAKENALKLNVPSLEARCRLLETRVLRNSGAEEGAALLERLEAVARLLEGSKGVELRGELERERGETLVAMRDVDGAGRCFRRARDCFQEIADRLPRRQREGYLARHRVAAPSEELPVFREVPGTPESSGASPKNVNPTTPATIPPEQEEFLRVASLLQEMGQTGSSQIFLLKVLTCLVRALGADQGFLLNRGGQQLRVVAAIDGRGERIRKAASYLCLEVLQDVFDSGEAVLAPVVLEDPKVHVHESLYHGNINALAVLPLKTEGSTRGALYLNNPDPEHLRAPGGSPVLMAYQNLLALILPRPVPA